MRKSYLLLLTVLVFACGEKAPEKSGLQFSEKGRAVPEFSSDSAFAFIEAQLADGPRVPNTYGHVQTRKYLESKLREYAGSNSVFSQEFTTEGYSGELKLANVIAAFNTTTADRIMLCAHWDTRPRADQDSVRTADFIDGADDGGSGVGILLEIARIMADNPPPIGVDIVLFDGEDYGTGGDVDYYFLGSRYWSKNPPVPGYAPRFGILLDMVGGEGARFPKEQTSMRYAPNLMEELWSIADDKGYEQLFPNEAGSAVLDDHTEINKNTSIPVIDIINHSKGEDGNIVFPSYWHTHQDNIDIISKETLQGVGDVLLELIYNRI